MKIKPKPKLTTDYVVKILDAIGRGKIEFLHKQEILKNNFTFQKFALEFKGFRIVVGVELGEVKELFTVRRTGESSDDSYWNKECLTRKDRNPWDDCSDAAHEKIDNILRDDDGTLIKVEKKYVVTYNGTQAGRRLERGKDGTVILGKASQMAFPVEATRPHDTPREAKVAAEKLRVYLAAYEKTKAKRKSTK